ncbi:hypothetical protein [Streptomyces sp. GZWMJZ-114]|uniref:hypothetical protein n=1 Tax=Streptomyces sp. GZWMJZ-114 TaxID=2494734 RepID=UPI0013E99B53|nr:hypothetical protein [Streptomyces sp. GZWMJZ-114]
METFARIEALYAVTYEDYQQARKELAEVRRPLADPAAACGRGARTGGTQCFKK